MSTKPLISFGVPAYNCAGTISRTVNSILNCGINDLEIICVDDASTDDTRCVIGGLAKSDPRIRIISNEKNIGILASRKIIARQANGLLFVWVDSDDCILPSLKKLIDRYLDKLLDGSMLIHNAYISKSENDGFSLLYKGWRNKTTTPSKMLYRAALAEGVGAYPWSFVTTSSNVKIVYSEIRLPRDYIDDQSVFYKYFTICSKVYLADDITYIHYLSEGTDSHKQDFYERLSKTYKFESEQPLLSPISKHLIGKAILNEKFYYVSGGLTTQIKLSKSELRIALKCLFSRCFRLKTKVIFLTLIISPYLFRQIFSKKRRF